MISGLLDVLWPSKCVACDRVLGEGEGFCAECYLSVELVPPEGCRTCAEPGLFEFGVCLRCLARPSPLRSAIAPFAHEGAIARAIHRLKYEDHPELTAPLTSVWLSSIENQLRRSIRWIVPLPLHLSRFRERRFDQSFLLARELARRTGRTLLPALKRTRKTVRQVGLSERARNENVAGAFVAEPSVAGRKLLLVDDVLTTGATARAAAEALMAAGAREVHLVTIAKAYTL